MVVTSSIGGYIGRLMADDVITTGLCEIKWVARERMRHNMWYVSSFACKQNRRAEWKHFSKEKDVWLEAQTDNWRERERELWMSHKFRLTFNKDKIEATIKVTNSNYESWDDQILHLDMYETTIENTSFLLVIKM